MSATADDWRSMCRTDDLQTWPGRRRVRVRFDSGRSHDVTVKPTDDGYLLIAEVTDPDFLVTNEYLYAWMRNRRSQLVGFRVTSDGTLIAHGWTPRAGLTATAFQLLIRTVAREADRYELQLTGLDKR